MSTWGLGIGNGRRACRELKERRGATGAKPPLQKPEVVHHVARASIAWISAAGWGAWRAGLRYPDRQAEA